ncbi:GNAT family N-acetyltransferase [Saliphagus infecundisoli]|uniref:GNAT family N-acetyltransferase n=1 Tax=Saliphagus infecundisoli TaxID=1849069 RepID=A0ABD5QCS6_9EURY|nr:GNAT family protein [Saliphagus infecundisoli]
MPGHVFLEGAKVALRPIERTDPDLEVLGRVRNNPSLRRKLGFEAPWSKSRIEEFVDSVIPDDSSINLFLCPVEDRELPRGDQRDPSSVTQQSGQSNTEDVGTIAGAINLFDINGTSGTVSYWLFEEHRGHGLATESMSLLLDYAFDERRLHRVEAEVFEGNESSRTLLSRLGFVHEGTSRDARFTEGAFRDAHQYGLLAPEWTNRERA